MQTKSRRTAIIAVVALVLAAMGGMALAQDTGDDPPVQLGATLTELNDSGAESTVTITPAVLSAESVTVTISIEGTGFSPGLVHAQHIHGTPGEGPFSCPPPDLAGEDGLISTAEGVPAYGMISLSLTTEGDTSPASGLAVDRMPVADDDGNISYERTFSVPDEMPANVLASITDLHLVQHGIDLNGNGEYDGEARSSIAPDRFPLEATIPAVCGGVELAQVGDTAVDRLGGQNRFETAVEISQEAFPETATVVYVANAEVNPDALVGGTLTDGPILLVPASLSDDTEVPQVVLDEVARLQPSRVVALGGDAVVGDDVLTVVAAAAEAIDAENGVTDG